MEERHCGSQSKRGERTKKPDTRGSIILGASGKTWGGAIQMRVLPRITCEFYKVKKRGTRGRHSARSQPGNGFFNLSCLREQNE